MAMALRGHVPERQCAGCGQRAAKAELVRFVVDPRSGRADVCIDTGSKAGGRGAYVCRRVECYDLATGKRGSLRRRLRDAAVGPGLRDEFIRLIGD